MRERGDMSKISVSCGMSGFTERVRVLQNARRGPTNKLAHIGALAGTKGPAGRDRGEVALRCKD